MTPMETMEITRIRPAEEFGSVLVSRFLGAELRLRVEHLLDECDVVIDFAGVEAISPSFADELFAKVPAEGVQHRGRLQFKNLGAETRALARFVAEGRGVHVAG